MSRRNISEKNKIKYDPIYHNKLVSMLVTRIIKDGKKYLAYKIIYQFVKHLKKETKKNPLVFLRQAIRILNPGVTIRKRNEGYPVLIELGFEQGNLIAIKWLLRAARKRSGTNMVFKLSSELIDATKGSGYAICEKEKLLRIAEANRTIAYSN